MVIDHSTPESEESVTYHLVRELGPLFPIRRRYREKLQLAPWPKYTHGAVTGNI